MKGLFCIAFLFLGTINILCAQAPSAIPYQAVARNSSGNLIANQNISVRFSIREVSASGTILYRETHSVATNALGLFVVNIGQGTPVSGTFSSINWGSNAKFMQVELDPTGGSSYTDMGTQQMLSVPYALYANSGGTPPIAGTGINVTGTTITNTAPDQTVTLTGNGATTVTGTYPNFTVSSTDANTTYNGSTGINVTGTTITNTAPDQTVTLTGNGATTVTGTYPNFTVSSTDANTTYNGGTGINVTGTTITNTAPDQTVTLTGNGATTVTGTYPNFTVSSTDANTTYTGGTGINVTGTTITNTSPDQTVTLTGNGATSVTGTYPNFTVSSTDANTTYTGGTGINVTGTTITNTAPDQTVTLTGGGITSVTGIYPNFTLTSTETDPQVSSTTTNRVPKWNGTTLTDGTITDNGNIGIGTTTPANKLDVEGGVAIGALYAGSSSGSGNGAIIQGSVGVGTAAPVNKLDVEGGVAIGAAYSGTSAAPGNGALIEGNVGIGTDTPANKLDVEGGVAIGVAYSGTSVAPNNGVLIQGLVGIGTDTPANKLDVEGGVAIGASFSGTSTAPSSGAIIQGNVGVGTAAPVNKLDIEGSVAIGAAYSGTSTAPGNGALIEGNVGIGTATSVNKLDVAGDVAIGAAYAGISTAPNNGAIIQGNVGIGTSSPTQKLSVSGNANVTGDLGIGTSSPLYPLHVVASTESVLARLESASTQGTYLYLTNTSAGGSPWYIFSSGSGNSEGAGNLLFGTGGDQKMTLKSSTGGLGIGTTSPVNKLDVEGGVAIGVAYSGASSAPSNGALIQGNVGIGTTAPSEKLEVSGKTKTTFLQITQGATDGYLLQSDASGNADWVSATNVVSSALTLNGENGLMATGSTVKLGGTLTETTTIYTDGNSLDVRGTLGSNSVDQSQATDNAFITPFTSAYQSFTTGSGIGNAAYLTAITLKNNTSGLSDPVATLNIYAGTGTGGSLLGSEPITISGSNSQGVVTTYNLATPVAISANTTYTFQIVLSVTPTSRWLFFNLDNPYAGGQSSINGWDMYFVTYYANSSSLFYVDAANERVGIGTANPEQAKLVVDGSNTQEFAYGYLNGNGITGFYNGGGTRNYSIYASDRIACAEFNAFSDARIKNILGLSDSHADLQTLMNIEITDYKLKDHIAKGTAEYKKVIAQQVEQVYPQAVNKMTDVVPDIYQLASIQNGYVSLTNTLKAGDRVKLIFGERSEVLEVISADANGFKVNLSEEGKVFVYGREVSDFRTVDYEALSTLNISATQELVKMINRLEDKNAKMQQGMSQLKADLDQIKAALQLNAGGEEVGKRQMGK